MKLLLKGILFGTLLTLALFGITYGIMTLVQFLDSISSIYPFIFVFTLISVGFSLAYYFGNK